MKNYLLQITRVMRSCVVILVLLLLWQIANNVFQFPDYILPSPLAIFKTWAQQWNMIANQAIPTIIETLLGLFLGCLLGVIAALCIAYFRSTRHWLLPILLLSQAIPTFAIAPLLVIWFGYGMASKIACTLIMLFFPITSNFYDGLRRTPAEYLDLANVMHASNWQIFLKVRIPAALPSLASGLKIAATIAPIGAIVGEWVGSSQGLGYLMLNANARMQIPLMFAALFTIIVLTLLLYFIVDIGTKKLIYWQKE